MRQNRGGGVGIQPLVTTWAQILIGGTLARVLKERWGGGGGLSPYFYSCLIYVLAAKHLPCSSPIHITPVLLHP